MSRRRSLLTPSERALAFEPPADVDEALRRYGLELDDLPLIRRRRRAHNRLGFAVQLALVRDLGRPIRSTETPPESVIAIVAEQRDLPPSLFEHYGERDETRREHIAEITALLGLRSLRRSDYRDLIAAAEREAAATDHGLPIVRAVLEQLRASRIVTPPADLVERLALAGRARARRASWAALTSGLDDDVIAKLDDLLLEREGGVSWHGWLNDAPEGVRLKNLKAVVERIQHLRTFAIDDDRRSLIHAHRYGALAREARIVSARQIAQFTPKRRTATLVACMIERRAALIDLAIDMADRSIGSVRRMAQTKRREREVARARETEAVADAHHRLATALLEARAEGADLNIAIDNAIGWEALAQSAERAKACAPGDGIGDMIERYVSLRRIAGLLYAAFDFRSYRDNEPIMKAIALLRALHTGARRSLPEKPPVVFLRHAWRSRVRDESGRIDRRAYEVAVLVHVQAKLRSGDLWVEGSRAYRTFEDYLMPREQFATLRDRSETGLAVPSDVGRWLDDRAALLREKMRAVSELAAAGELPDVEIDAQHGLKIKPIERDAADRAIKLSKRLHALLPRVRVTELLAEVHGWTGFLDRFHHFSTGRSAEDQAALMGAILADATNLGLERMAESSRGMTLQRLDATRDRHVRPESYAGAIAAIVDAQHTHPFAAIWGDGDAASSDGQFFPAGGKRERAADYNARHGKKPGAVFYGHISDRFASFHSKVIRASASEAVHVLDGLLHHESALDIREHTTDSAGAVELCFAMFHLFGFRFAPRIKGLADRRLYVVDRDDDHGALAPLIGGFVDIERIRENWDEVLRLAASIRSGFVTPSVILAKIAAFPRQNELAKTLREIGRMERAIFTCDWLLDAHLRRRSNANLNKGESRHALARAVFLHQNGELRDQTAEATAHRASGLNLVVNAIILWNTTYLARAADFVRSKGVLLDDADLARVAPARWGHIGLTGDYIWSEIGPTRDRHRPLRTTRFDKAAFDRLNVHR